MWVLAGFSVAALAVMIYLFIAHMPFVCVPMALKRIRSAKDPAAEGSRVADRMMAAVDWLNSLKKSKEAVRMKKTADETVNAKSRGSRSCSHYGFDSTVSVSQ